MEQRIAQARDQVPDRGAASRAHARGIALLGLLVLSSCRSDYVALSRELARGTPARSEPVTERQRTWYDRENQRPRRETMVLLLPGGSCTKHGIEREWYPSGQLQAEREYRHGQPAGRWTAWYESGSLRSECSFDPDETTPMTWWYEDGQVSTSGFSRDGVREGRWTSWYPDGARKCEGSYLHNRREGEWTSWNPDGTVAEQGLYRAGERVGTWTFDPGPDAASTDP